MAFKTFEFGGMSLFESGLFAWAVAFKACRTAVCLNIPVKNIIGDTRITLS